MFKLPGSPSPLASVHELADYAEWVCWKDNGTSMTTLTQDLGRLGENDYTRGVPEEEETPRLIAEAFIEIERRGNACRDGYPFALGKTGYTLAFAQGSKNNKKKRVYQYLLLATRLNMTDNRRHADIDGTLLFEELAADAAQAYFGLRSEKLIFGTSTKGSDFPAKVNELCQLMQEGDGFVNRDEAEPKELDGGLDIVVWKPFADNLPGKLIGFGQCKTGTHYRQALASLQPSTFCENWLYTSPTVPPVRMFFVAEALPRYNWNSTARKAGILFDRCRIVDYCDDIGVDVLKKVTKWTIAAKEHLADT